MMRIAQVAPLFESVPPKYYGGTERIVSYLTEELVNQGHQVTLFASGDSVTRAHLVPLCPKSLRLDPDCVDPLALHILMLEQIFKRASDFDLIHFHIDYLHFPVCRREPVIALTTLHGREDIPELAPLYHEYADMMLSSISYHQRTPIPWVNWQGNVYHGLPEKLYTFHERQENYLAFLGRISPEKGLHYAIEIARRAGLPLKIAAKLDKKDLEYFKNFVEPHLKKPEVEWIGEIGESEKNNFLGQALALLFPIDWPEPFGLVMIEALACGTPVIAFRCGSVPEILEDGVSGFIVENVDQAVKALSKISSLSRVKCREIFEEKFTVTQMTQNYLKIYERILRQNKERK